MGVIDNVKEVADLVKKIGDVELYRKIVELEGEVIELTRQVRSSEEKIGELNGVLKFKEKLTFKAPFYFADGDAVPYCAHCWESANKAIHLIHEFTNSERTRHDCPHCKRMILIDHGKRQSPEFGSGGAHSWMR